MNVQGGDEVELRPFWPRNSMEVSGHFHNLSA